MIPTDTLLSAGACLWVEVLNDNFAVIRGADYLIELNLNKFVASLFRAIKFKLFASENHLIVVGISLKGVPQFPNSKGLHGVECFTRRRMKSRRN